MLGHHGKKGHIKKILTEEISKEPGRIQKEGPDEIVVQELPPASNPLHRNDKLTVVDILLYSILGTFVTKS